MRIEAETYYVRSTGVHSSGFDWLVPHDPRAADLLHRAGAGYRSGVDVGGGEEGDA